MGIVFGTTVLAGLLGRVLYGKLKPKRKSTFQIDNKSISEELVKNFDSLPKVCEEERNQEKQ